MFNKQHNIIISALVNYFSIVGGLWGTALPEISGKFQNAFSVLCKYYV